MIVYGDPSYDRRLPELVASLRANLATPWPPAATDALDSLRGMLIAAGQVEQAAEDAAIDEGVLTRVRALTDGLADAFVARFSGDDVGASAGTVRVRLDELVAEVPDVPVHVKVPEGFAFYTLYPEQYCEAAARWLADHAARRGSGRAVILGVRSIGTTLSAVVRAVLARGGWDCLRLTVRPSGHPFDRQVKLPDIGLLHDACGLIVDEGPGISGSSMVAAARALLDAGVPRERISLLPGHGGEPGNAASDATRTWFREGPRYVASVGELRWKGRTLREVLTEQTSRITGEPVERVDDLGGGAWRRFVYPAEDQWPPAFPAFERTKYRCVTRAGAVLWKFAGLTADPSGGSGSMADAQATRQAKLGEAGWTPAPLGTAMGFVATPWFDGRPLRREDATPDLLAHVARYVVAASPGVLSLAEQRAAWDRLAAFLPWNTQLALGEAAGERAKAMLDAARRLAPAAPVLAYGDGRLAPHEWLGVPGGRVMKTDCTGHERDHTCVGRQSIAWDLAGALSEWGGDPESDATLLAAFRAAGGPEIPPPVLHLHRMAYAAFRLGMCSLLASGTSAPVETQRLQEFEASLRRQLTNSVSVRSCRSGLI